MSKFFSLSFKRFGKDSSSREKRRKTPKSRRLALENLEIRELLSVSTFDVPFELDEHAPVEIGSPASTDETALSSDALLEAIEANSAEPIGDEIAQIFEVAEPNAAKTWTVTSVSDNINDTGSLRYLISAANDGDTIKFSSSLDGKTINLGGSQLEIVDKSITIDAGGLNITINGYNTSRVFYVHHNLIREHPSLTLAGLVITNGTVSGSGGGVCAENADLTMTNCTVANCESKSSILGGGAVSISSGNATFNNCVITQNNSDCHGAGISYNADASYQMIVSDCAIYQNTSKSYGGGGIYSSGKVVLNRSEILRNTSISSNGGGVYANTGTLTVNGSLIAENNADAGYGGGIYTYGASVTLNSATISANMAKQQGGGIYSTSNASVTAYNSIIVGNEATNSPEYADVYKPANAIFRGYNTLSTFNGWNTSSSCYVYQSSKPLFGSAYTLAKNSQAIDRGDNTYAQQLGFNVDLAGGARIVNGTIDLGAYEYQTSSTRQLDAPTISGKSSTTSSITINWNAVSGANGYFAVCGSQTKNLGDSARSATFTGLSANTTYTVKVKAFGNGTTTTDSSYSSVSVKTQPNSPSTPIQLDRPALTATATTASSITVKWGKIANASSYTISYAVKSTSPVYKTKTVAATATTNTITGLQPNTNYYVKIKANGDGVYYEDSAQSPTITAKTIADPVQLARPTLTATATTANSITVKWGKIANASSYTISYAVKSTSPVYKTKTVAATATSNTITGLQPNTNYYVKIKANGDGVYYKDSAQSPTITAKTIADPVQLARPALTANATTASSITVKWGRIANASSYTISYAVKSTSPVYKTKTVAASATSNTITGLQPNTNYYVKIKAIGDGVYYKDSAQSPTITAKTIADPVQLARPALTATATTASSIAVKWGKIANASSYTISYAVKSTSPVYKTITVGATATTRTITGLQPNTNYYVKIKANGDGVYYKDSAQSPTVTAKTLATNSNALLDEAFGELFEETLEDEFEIEFA